MNPAYWTTSSADGSGSHGNPSFQKKRFHVSMTLHPRLGPSAKVSRDFIDWRNREQKSAANCSVGLTITNP